VRGLTLLSGCYSRRLGLEDPYAELVDQPMTSKDGRSSVDDGDPESGRHVIHASAGRGIERKEKVEMIL
jgi:hypothetical protein